DIIDEKVDCVIRGGELTDSSLKARLVGELRLGLCAAPSYLKQAGTPTIPSDLESSHHRVVGYRWARTGKLFPYIMRNKTETIEVKVQYILSVDDGNAYLAAGLAGLGVLWLPEYMSKPHLANGELIPLLESWSLEPMPLYAAYSPTHN